jgi:hypothetical protein
LIRPKNAQFSLEIHPVPSRNASSSDKRFHAPGQAFKPSRAYPQVAPVLFATMAPLAANLCQGRARLVNGSFHLVSSTDCGGDIGGLQGDESAE